MSSKKVEVCEGSSYLIRVSSLEGPEGCTGGIGWKSLDSEFRIEMRDEKQVCSSGSSEGLMKRRLTLVV